jgi:hypothetical protein
VSDPERIVPANELDVSKCRNALALKILPSHRGVPSPDASEQRRAAPPDTSSWRSRQTERLLLRAPSDGLMVNSRSAFDDRYAMGPVRLCTATRVNAERRPVPFARCTRSRRGRKACTFSCTVSVRVSDAIARVQSVLRGSPVLSGGAGMAGATRGSAALRRPLSARVAPAAGACARFLSNRREIAAFPR